MNDEPTNCLNPAQLKSAELEQGCKSAASVFKLTPDAVSVVPTASAFANVRLRNVTLLASGWIQPNQCNDEIHGKEWLHVLMLLTSACSLQNPVIERAAGGWWSELRSSTPNKPVFRIAPVTIFIRNIHRVIVVGHLPFSQGDGFGATLFTKPARSQTRAVARMHRRPALQIWQPCRCPAVATVSGADKGK